MMNNARSIFWFLVLIAAVSACHVLLSVKGGPGGTLLPVRTSLSKLHASALSKIAIRRSGTPETVLEKTGEWRLVEPFRSAVDERVVMKLADAFSFADIEEAISAQELLKLGRSRADLGLDAPQLGVTLWEDGDKAPEEFSIGSFTPDGRGVYAAASGDDSVFVVSSNLFAAAGLDAGDLRRKTLFDAGPELVQSFDIKRPSGSFLRFVKNKDSWTIASPTLSSASNPRVNALLSETMAASASEFVWPVGAEGEGDVPSSALLAGYGLEPESAVTVTMKCADGKDRQISFGKKAKDGCVWALCQDSGSIAMVDGRLKDLASAGLAEFTDYRLFPYDESEITHLAIADGDTSYLIARDSAGDWRLESPVSAATDAASVETLFDNLARLSSADMQDGALAVTVNTNGVPVSVGRDALLKGMRLEDLRSREILSIDPQSVRRIVATPGGADPKPTAVVFDRDRTEWLVETSPRPGVADAAAVESVLDAVRNLEAKSIVHLKVGASELKRYSLDAPRFVLAIDLAKKDSTRRNLLVGDKCKGGFYATLGASDAVFVISDEAVKAMSRPLTAE